MKKYIPKYLVQKNNVILTVLGTALFAEIFITVFQPFGSRQWLPEEDSINSALIYFALATLVVLTAMGIIAVSRTIMYKRGKHHEITYGQYAIWIIAEVLAMATTYFAAVVIVYTLYPQLAERTGELNQLTLFAASIRYTALILFIPYSVFIIYFSLNYQKKQLEKTLGNANADEAKGNENSTILNFYDEKGELNISIRPENLFYIAAADNYVDIIYKNSGKVKHFMLRQSLKNIEETFRDKNLIRCHRSYIVNIPMVKVLRRSDEGILLDFDEEQVEHVPVSKTYKDNVISVLTA